MRSCFFTALHCICMFWVHEFLLRGLSVLWLVQLKKSNTIGTLWCALLCGCVNIYVYILTRKCCRFLIVLLVEDDFTPFSRIISIQLNWKIFALIFDSVYIQSNIPCKNKLPPKMLKTSSITLNYPQNSTWSGWKNQVWKFEIYTCNCWTYILAWYELLIIIIIYKSKTWT